MVKESAAVQVRSCVFSSYLRWNGHSPDLLDLSETSILSHVKEPFEKFYVSLGDCVGVNDEIWTLSMNTASKNTPILMLHGYSSGIALWVKNLEEIAANRPLYATDLLGFGKSSRPNFSTDPNEIDEQYVKSIETWRERMGISKMILLGHSFGGYLAGHYALKHPKRIEHLILVDSWGFSGSADYTNLPFWKRVVARIIPKVNLLGFLRVAGSYGQSLVAIFRSGILKIYENVVQDKNVIAQYIHQCNSNQNASGEKAFRNLLKDGPWPKDPIGKKLRSEIDENIPMTFIYGEKSWMDNKYGAIIKDSRTRSYTNIEIVKMAGHHLFADKPKDFNRLVIEASKILKSQTEF